MLVLIGWVFFYYEKLGDGLFHIGIMFGIVKTSLTDPTAIYYFKHYLLFLVAAVLACIPWKVVIDRLPCKKTVEQLNLLLKPLILTALFLLGMATIITQSYNPFLYFRF